MGALRPRCRMLLVVLLKQKLSLNPEITIHWMVTVDILLNAMGLSFTFWKMGIFMILTHYKHCISHLPQMATLCYTELSILGPKDKMT